MDAAIRELFPAAVNSTYLNTAAISPVPTNVIKAVNSQLEDVSNYGLKNFDEWTATRERVRGRVATMLGVKSDDIGFVRNTSDGMCAVAAGLDWRAGDNIVTCAAEFPANYYPWRKLKDDKGVELRFACEVDGRIDVDELCALIDERTRVVAVSAVQYATGFKLDLERIGRVARQHDALLVVDIIQAFGAMPFDLTAQYVDVASAGSYKWLCAPEGCGVFYASERARERVKPISRGWISVAKPFDFDDRDQQMPTTTRAWETGVQGSALYYGLDESLRMLCDVGIEKIGGYLEELTDFLCEIAPTKKYRIYSSRAAGEKSQIVSLMPLNGTTSEQIADRLAADSIAVSARGPLVRIAPHFFNNFEDIERVAAAL